MNNSHQHPLKRRGFHGQSGMTMFEMLISIVVGAIVSAGLANQVINSVKLTQLTSQSLQAAFLLEEKVEEIIHLRKTLGTDAINAITLPDESPVAADFSQFSRHMVFQDDTTGTCPTGGECLEVDVTVEAGGEFRAGTRIVLLKGDSWIHQAPL